jgi:hypothetical protein
MSYFHRRQGLAELLAQEGYGVSRLEIRLPGKALPSAGHSMRISRDWWAVLAAAALIVLIKLGAVTRVPW